MEYLIFISFYLAGLNAIVARREISTQRVINQTVHNDTTTESLLIIRFSLWTHKQTDQNLKL